MSDLVTFCSVAAARSFSEAAKRLGISRALASKRIQDLEGRLGTRLISRSTRGFALTEAGEVFYRRGQDIANRIQQAEREVQDLASSHAGKLRLAAPLMCSYIGVPLSKALLDRYPDLEFHLTIVDDNVDVINGGYDVAIQIGELRDTNLICRKITESRFCVVATPDYLDEHGAPESPKDLRRFNCLAPILCGERNWTFKTFDSEPFTMTVTGNFSSSSDIVLYRACLMGLGLCQLLSPLIYDDIRNGRLVRVLEDYAFLTHDIFLIYPSKEITEKTRTMIDALVDFTTERLPILPPNCSIS